jgi:hypothetical protein
MAKIIRVDGTEEPIEGELTLELMQGVVGGYIEIAYMQDGRMIVLDEEGKLKNKPVNEAATILYNNPNDFIVGDIILANEGEID